MAPSKKTPPIKKHHIEPQTGIAFSVAAGQTIRVIDVEGEQVTDLFCAAVEDSRECLSSGHTTDYNSKLFLSTGDVLYSNQSRPMLTITADQVGGHMMLYAPCSQAMFEKSYGATEPHANCQDNLAGPLAKFGIRPTQITVPFNLNMHVEINREGQITIQPPQSRAGDYLELRAEMDLIVGISACSAGLCNNYSWTPIEVEIQ